MRRLIWLLALECCGAKIYGASQTITVNPDKRLKAVISADSMNRLAVANDRITNIYGDNDAYEVQTEESTGQLFLKPTLENGKKPLAITLITETGLTQDLTLEPMERDAATVILKNTATSIDATGGLGAFPSASATALATSQVSASSSQAYGHGHGFGTSAGFGMYGQTFGGAAGFQDQVIGAMKYLVADQSPSTGLDSSERKGPKSIEISLIGTVNRGNFKGLKLDIKNISDVPMDILEKDFYQAGDLAFVVEKRVLPPKASTVLYVVARS